MRGGKAADASPVPQGGAQEQQLMDCRKTRSLLCYAYCWAPRDTACALCMCGTSVYYGITSHLMSMCMLAHENVDGALHCLHACVCMAYVLSVSACMVQCALCGRLHKFMYVCAIVCLQVFEFCCMCRRGLTRIVCAMCVSAHAYTAALVYVCVSVRGCLLMETKMMFKIVLACAWHLAWHVHVTLPVVHVHARINARLCVCACHAHAKHDVAVTAS